MQNAPLKTPLQTTLKVVVAVVSVVVVVAFTTTTTGKYTTFKKPNELKQQLTLMLANRWDDLRTQPFIRRLVSFHTHISTLQTYTRI